MRKQFISIFILLLFGTIITAANAAHSVRYTKVKCGGIWLQVVTVNLNSPEVVVTPAVSRYGIGHSESFRSLLRRTRPAAAIDGTYFCTRTLRPSGDIVIDGRSVWRGFLGTALVFDGSGKAELIPTRNHELYDATAYQNVIAAGPSLIMNGRMAVMPRSQGFYSRVHYTRKLRAAIGITYSNKLVLALTTKPVYLSKLAKALKQLNCRDAACLDGGSSAGLYCKGKLIANPKRKMTNCILVYDNPKQYLQVRSKLSPLPAAGEQRADIGMNCVYNL